MLRILSSLLLVCFVVAPLGAAPLKPADVEKAQKAAMDFAKKKSSGRQLRVQNLTTKATLEVAPRTAFFSLVVPQFPVAFQPPKGLSNANILAVDGDGKVKPFKDSGEFTKYFYNEVDKARTDDQAKNIVRAWLSITKEFSQDGFYTFTLMDEATKLETKDGKRIVSGKVVVMKGGNGTITAKVQFDKSGFVENIEHDVTLQPGPRPRCHATKLLNDDPIIRRIMEDDLLYMGKSALPYLREQRAKAEPELRKAIDRIIDKIRSQDR